VCCAKGSKTSKLWLALRYGFRTLPGDIGRPLIVGLLIAAAISAVLPEDFFARYLGSGFSAMLVMMIIGLPIYVCATASVPIAAALIAKGISPGAAFVFLATGPATNAATVMTIWKIMGLRAASIYLLSAAATALLSGFALDSLFSATNTTVQPLARERLPLWFRSFCALILLAVLLHSLLPKPYKKVHAEPEPSLHSPSHSKHEAEEPFKAPCNHSH